MADSTIAGNTARGAAASGGADPREAGLVLVGKSAAAPVDVIGSTIAGNRIERRPRP